MSDALDKGDFLMKRHSVIVIGGGPSGITCGYYLKERGIDYLILEKEEMLHTWRNERWDSFYLVTPNWMTYLPGFENEIPYNNEYMSKAEILNILERYLEYVAPRYCEHTDIQSVERVGEQYHLQTNRGVYMCDHIIVASGMYSEPFIPSVSEKLPSDIFQMHSSDYKGPDQLNPGNTLVVGSGWSGVQIALEIKKSLVTDVYLSIGSLSPLPAVYKNVHGVYWLNRLSGYGDIKKILHYGSEDFKNPNILGKMSQNLVECQRNDVKLIGRLLDFDPDTCTLKLGENVKRAFVDANAYLETVKGKIDDLIHKESIHVTGSEFDLRLDQVDLERLPGIPKLILTADNIKNIIWSTGFKRNYSYIKRPIFDESGLPILKDGVSTSENITFCGLELEVDRNIKSAFGIGLYAIDESSKRAVDMIP